MSALGFKARVDPLVCMFYRLYTTYYSDSPLVRHLPTSRQSILFPMKSRRPPGFEARYGQCRCLDNVLFQHLELAGSKLIPLFSVFSTM